VKTIMQVLTPNITPAKLPAKRGDAIISVKPSTNFILSISYNIESCISVLNNQLMTTIIKCSINNHAKYTNQIEFKIKLRIFSNIIKSVIGQLYPPRNNIVVNIDINNILAYSAKKKNTNIEAACSVMKPLTNSDSYINM